MFAFLAVGLQNTPSPAELRREKGKSRFQSDSRSTLLTQDPRAEVDNASKGREDLSNTTSGSMCGEPYARQGWGRGHRAFPETACALGRKTNLSTFTRIEII